LATLQITSFPAQVGVEEYLSISGTAQDLARQPLTLVIDNQYRMGAGAVPDNGLWSFRFRFTSSGRRSLAVLATDDRGQTVSSQTIVISVVNASLPLLQVTSYPYQVQQAEACIINGIARELDGRPLTLTVDDRYQSSVGNIPAGGSWSIRFRFNSTGSRKLVFSATNAQGSLFSSPPITMLVLDDLPPNLTIVAPPQVAVRQEFSISGTADGVIGQPVTLTIDNQLRANAGTVAANGTWQTQFQFLQAGSRRLTASLESLASPVRSETLTIAVVAASPRLTITPPTQPIYAGSGFVLAGGAKNFADGEQLVLRVDGQYILARPIVQNQRWQAALFFNQAGKRRVELISSDQEQEEIQLTVLPTPSALKLFARSIWTPTLTPEGIPDLLNPKRITLHHTVIANLSTSATQQQEIQRMRTVLNIHLNSSGYSDIGYHYIVMPSGRVYEARSSRKRGAHDLVNDGIGVAVDGDFQGSLRIGVQQYDAVVETCIMLCKRMGITDPITPVSTTTADFGTRQLSRICGHQDRVATGCPGTVYSRLSEIRRDVKQEL
jgi:hypothetical protein